ncbi:MAG: hypothetical protein LBJ59_11415, partial [Zoogloeaceae bacterium]|nr:hypothetical protein [Zoogloeaceae bacterium]
MNCFDPHEKLLEKPTFQDSDISVNRNEIKKMRHISAILMALKYLNSSISSWVSTIHAIDFQRAKYVAVYCVFYMNTNPFRQKCVNIFD